VIKLTIGIVQSAFQTFFCFEALPTLRRHPIRRTLVPPFCFVFDPSALPTSLLDRPGRLGNCDTSALPTIVGSSLRAAPLETMSQEVATLYRFQSTDRPA